MRGERWKSTVSRHSRIGSSPHARGTPAREARVHYQHRFIPACAGNASAGWTGRCASSVHPRMRGERLSVCCVVSMGVRFIPACAGNATRRRSAHWPASVHPRMRGERIGLAYLSAALIGSSPHARGTPDAELRRLDVARFIPACAGNASMRATTRSPQPVHPRMRGERCVTHSMCPAIGGSSPHARGTLPVQPKYFAPTRFIPACAGNANIVLYSAPFISVHPRMRGERCASCAPPFVLNGSSPHARGTRCVCRHD